MTTDSGGGTTVEVDGADGVVVGDTGGGVLVSVSVTGQTVVPIEIVSVVTCGSAGQFVTVGAQEVTVCTLVV